MYILQCQVKKETEKLFIHYHDYAEEKSYKSFNEDRKEYLVFSACPESHTTLLTADTTVSQN